MINEHPSKLNNFTTSSLSTQFTKNMQLHSFRFFFLYLKFLVFMHLIIFVAPRLGHDTWPSQGLKEFAVSRGEVQD
jgi:hypothetical protein